jgi:hypothetical protein
MNLYLSDILGIAGRVEVLRYRRGYLDDTLLLAGVGLGF